MDDDRRADVDEAAVGDDGDEPLIAGGGVDELARPAGAEIRRGALASLAERYRFWEGVQREIVLYRQPRSVRQDGVAQRSLAVEVLLTAWDAVPGAHRLENKLGSWRSRLRPALNDVLRQTHEL